MSEFVKVANTADVPPGEGLLVEVQGREIGLFNVDGEIHAMDNICPHHGGPLVEGQLAGSVVACPWHAWTFDVTSGKCTFVEGADVERFVTRIENGEIFIAVA